MEITCYPYPNGTIDEGFRCEMTGTGTFGSLELVDDGQGNSFFVDKAWTGGEIMTNYFLFIILVLIIGKVIFDFFLPPRIRIKKQT